MSLESWSLGLSHAVGGTRQHPPRLVACGQGYPKRQEGKDDSNGPE